MEDRYSVKIKKPDGKFWSVGNLKKNKWGNYEVGLKVDDVLHAAITSAPPGSWINLSLYPDDREQAANSSAQPANRPAQPIDDEIPW